MIRALVVLATALAVLAVVLWIAACSTIELPQSNPPCAAYGASVTLSGGQLRPSAGCIETAPAPGESMPPRSIP